MKYEIKGDNLPVVLCHLEAGEEMTCEGGSMSWLSECRGSNCDRQARQSSVRRGSRHRHACEVSAGEAEICKLRKVICI